MTLRSKLFATVAMPVLSATMAFNPAFAAEPVAAFEVAQASEEELQAQEAERQRLLLLEQQQADEAARAAAEQQAAEEAQRAAEQQAADEEAARAAAEQQAAQEAEQQRLQQEQQAAEQQAAEEAARAAAEQQAAEEAQRASEQQAADEEAARAAAEQQAAQEAEQQRLLQEQQAADEQAAEAARAAAEQQAAEDAQKAQEQQAQPQTEEAPATAEQPATEELPATAEQPAAEEQAPVAEEQPPVTEEQPATAEQPATEEVPATAEQPATQEQPATAEQPVPEGEQPTTEGEQATETPAQPEVVPEIVDTRTEEQNQQIAEDPAQTDETVVLPVEGGAAVLDSDKDADNTGGQTAREERRKLREAQRAEEAVAAPTTDAEAQTAVQVEAAAIQAAITEEGQRLQAAPVFVTPGDTNINNSTVTTTNNITNNITNIIVEQKVENRTVLRVDNQIIVRGDDRPRLRRDSEEAFYDELPRGRVRETIVRPGGTRIVTVYDRYGDVVQRSRIDRNGDEYLMAYSPDYEEDREPTYRDAGYDLPPMRLRIPVRDYIIDTSSDPDRDYYDFLAEPPVERVERVYSIDEVKYSARIRDKVRRIDLDTITFASGSAEVPLAQAKTLRKVATAISTVLEKDPGETFLIEGHTDAVGRDQPNLILSDERAEAVAELLTEVYGIPPENLTTQGYGERYLKVKTQVAEQQNRRVTIRRVTALVRPVAQAN